MNKYARYLILIFIKFSNVIEKFIENCDQNCLNQILYIIINSEMDKNLILMLKDPYGNYVL